MKNTLEKINSRLDEQKNKPMILEDRIVKITQLEQQMRKIIK